MKTAKKSVIEKISECSFTKNIGDVILCFTAMCAGLLWCESTVPGISIAAAEEELYVSEVFTEAGGFPSGIEGPACDIDGNLYAVNYEKKGTIGMVTPEGISSIFVELPDGSVGNGIRFNSEDFMMIADYVNHNILKVDMQTREISVHAHDSAMTQPNDIAIGANDIIYASDPNWGESSGQIWRIDTNGTVTLLESNMSTTNGIEVGPDDATLYVNEYNSGNVIAYDLSPDGEISSKRVLINFPDFGMDGMRCDVDGNLYITRIGKGTIAKVSPEGEVLLEVELIGTNPTNIAFGGTDGRTCYVTMSSAGNIETFRVEQPGRSWQLYENRRPEFIAERTGELNSFALSDNFPNPFNASTVIEYTLLNDSTVELTIHNMTGQKIAVIKEGTENAGKHSVRWDAGDLASGVYFYRLKVNGFTEMKKMLLLR